MVDSQGQIPKEALGMDLPVGHVHAHHRARSEAPPQCHRPAKRRVRSQTNVASTSERGRAHVPVVPQLRALRGDLEEIPVSESSAVSSASLRSGIVRAHPNHPIGGAMESSCFEVVPSSANRATSATGLDESIGLTPIARSSSSPSILNNPIRVMSPNMVAESASSASQLIRDPDFDPSMAKSLLQQWAEVKTEDGTVERTFTQCAQTWPLTDHVKLENIEAAIQIPSM